MECIKHDKVQGKKLEDLIGMSIKVDKIEDLVNNKSESVSKLKYKNKNDNDMFVLQRIRENNVDIWQFKQDFNKESAYVFIHQFDTKNVNNLNINGDRIIGHTKR